MLNFYRKFLRIAAGVLAPLMNALKGPGKSLTWSPTLDSAFPHAVPELVHPHPGAQISLAVDAPDSHMGSVLQKFLDGPWAPLTFFSKKLSASE